MALLGRGAKTLAIRGVALALVAAVVTQAGLPAFARNDRNDRCGTAWESRRIPPETIRVYRVGKDKVEIVPFKRYVAVVMAMEWPGYLPRAALEVGATAVKQYAWYHALKGNHRPWYVTDDGVCYDVTNTTIDQLYLPFKARVNHRIRAAVDATWGLSLRKSGRFFITTYRSGITWKCGIGADGWKVFARGVIACARRGMDRAEIQRTYYGRPMDFVWTGDGVRPDVSAPTVALAGHGTLGSLIGRVSWTGSDESGIARYRLQRRVAGEPWQDVDLARRDATRALVDLDDRDQVRFRVRARDETGLRCRFEVGSAARADVVETHGLELSRGRWRTDEDPTASGSGTRYTRSDGARATFTFTGRSIALVAPMGPDRGTVRISIDGRVAGTVDLGARRLRPQRVAFAVDWPKSRERTLTIVAVGNDRVDIDAFVVVR